VRFNYWPARFIGALAAIVVGVPTITFGTVAYWNQMATAEVAHAAACSPTVYGTTVGTTRYIVEEFTTVGSCDWTVPTGLTEVDVLVVGGGGGGGARVGAGGGAGGFVEQSITSLSSPVSVTVGAGGSGASSSSNVVTSHATDGSASSFGSVDAGGGGRGASNVTTDGPNYGHLAGPASGNGSAGGGARFTPAGSAGSAGNAGGAGNEATAVGAGGGGGAGGPGTDATASAAGAGGSGKASSITGSFVTYAGGGGGSSRGWWVAR